MTVKIRKADKGNEQIKTISHRNIKILNTVKREFILEGLGCANCAAKMETNIGKLQGVSNAAVNFVSKTLTMEIEELEKADELVAAAKEIVNDIESHVIVKDKEKNKNSKMVINLTGLCCANCAAKIEREANNIEGVKEAAVDFTSQKLHIEREENASVDPIIDKVTEIVHRIEPEVKVRYVAEKRSKIVSAEAEEESNKKELIRFGVGAVIYGAAVVFKFNFAFELMLFIISYILIGGEVVLKAIKNIGRGQVFDENFLMFIATVGAFAIGEFPEAVAVMLFYQIGEMFQDMAVDRSRKSISALMDIRPDYANLVVGSGEHKVSPEEVEIGDFIIVKPGEKVPLDGVVMEGSSMLDTSALTGEAVPRKAASGDEVLSGVINKNGLLKIKVSNTFEDSTVAKILDLVQNASSKKAPTESFITKFARFYTPVVVISAAALAFLPPLFIEGAEFSQWIYRALVFLVVSCPCALVVSIPLGFFGGIGGASKNGILVKGGNYLEALNDVDTVVFDKTGTLTKGVFNVTEVTAMSDLSEEDLLEYAAHAESYSNHPIAASIAKAYGKDVNKHIIENYNEISGHGIKVTIKGKEVLAGNAKLMDSEEIDYDKSGKTGTIVHLAIDRKYAGYIIISDEIKEDSLKAIKELKNVGVRSTVMLTGDNRNAAEKVGKILELDEVYAELLPTQKVEKIEELNARKPAKGKLIFVGDGINDAPVLARADIGIAMGGVGSDAAIEAADVVIMTDEPSKIVTAIKIAKKTKSIVIQNIVFALGVKIIILILGAFGVATMWEAVFGDVGVALIAVLNAMRAMKVEKVK
jgi:Zn2+/Cd2+-exporting ATPase